jgi:hypothetical protein
MKQADLISDANPPLEEVSSSEHQNPSVPDNHEEVLHGSASMESVAAESPECLPLRGTPMLGSSCYFPCNREDALLFLGSMCISEFFPETSVNLAIQPEGIAFLRDGLRVKEGDLLSAGRVERFPVLIEVKAEAADRQPRNIGGDDILGLIFRSQSEADDFKFRPVDEFNTEFLPIRIDESRFHLEGDCRFSVRGVLEESARATGNLVDRLSGGVLRLLILGNLVPSCRSEAVRFLCGQVDSVGNAEEFDFHSATSVISGSREKSSSTRHRDAVLSAFATFESGSPSSLIDQVMRRLSASPDYDDASAKVDTKWAEIARGVVKNQIELTGDLVSDDKSVALRSALLGLVVDRPRALTAFLDAEKPSGLKVTTTAAFLVGLKHGLMNTSWDEKKKYVKEISAVVRALVRDAGTKGADAGRLFRADVHENESTLTTLVCLDGVALSEWTEEKAVQPDQITLRWEEVFKEFSFSVVGKGKSTHSWLVQFSPERRVEVIHRASDEMIFAVMRYYFEENEKLKKEKELNSIFNNGGMFWYPGIDENGLAYMSCDVVTMPDKWSREFLLSKLDAAIAASVSPRKTKKRLVKSKT